MRVKSFAQFNESKNQGVNTLEEAIDKELQANEHNMDVDFMSVDLREIKGRKDKSTLDECLQKVYKKLLKKYKLTEAVNEAMDEIIFTDVNGVIAKVGDLIKNEEGEVAKVKRFFNSGKEDRMEVDFRSHYLEMNPMSKFEIIAEPDEQMAKAFESFKYADLSAIADKIYKLNQKELFGIGKTAEEEEAQETADTMADNNIDSYVSKQKIELTKKERKTLFGILSQNYYHTILDDEGDEE